MEEYLIEKGIPLIKCRAGVPRWILLYNEMEPGDSFVVPDEDMPKGFKTIQSSIVSASRRSGHKVATRRIKGGLRIWLLEHPEPK